MRCPRCSSALAPEQDWCLECGAPARTRLAPTPNWQLPTVAVGAMIALAGALLAFAFVKLTGDDPAPAGTPPAAVVQTTAPAVAPATGSTGTTPTAKTGTTSKGTGNSGKTTASSGKTGRTTTARSTPASKQRTTTTTTPSKTTTSTTTPRTRTLIEAQVPKPPD